MSSPGAGSPSIFSWFPERASTLAGPVDILYLALILTSGIVVAGLVVAILFFLVRYRRGSAAPRPQLRVSVWKIEATWIAITTIVFLGFGFWGAWLYLHQMRPPEAAYEIDVIGRQWMWDVRQPNGRREFDTLRVPVGMPVRLLLSSEDVIHSFFVPAFRIKQDVVPGKTVSLWFEATKAGTFHLFCTEYCGTKHSEMRGEVVAMPPEEYGRWLEAGDARAEVVERGRRLFLQHGCSGCHAPASSIRAPLLEGLYRRLVPLSDGSLVLADERYLRDSILLPQLEVVAGYEPIMPSFVGVLSENELLDLLTYMKSLRGEQPQPPAPQAVPTIPR